MKTNVKTRIPARPRVTHEGALAFNVSAEKELRRTVMACLLWEDSFYESGQDAASRIGELVPRVKPDVVASIATEAREKLKLRHVPLLLVREMARVPTHKHLVAETLDKIIHRPDELTEFLSIYWKTSGKTSVEKELLLPGTKDPLSAQVKKGLAQAFTKFPAYALAKYNRDEAIKLRDVLFLVHAKPKNKLQAKTWKQLVEGKLAAPDTWEVALSAGKDKKATWTRLIKQKKLGALAFLRNLRNMEEEGVLDSVIRKGFKTIDTKQVLPFRFIAAAKHAPKWEPEIQAAMLAALKTFAPLKGKTAILVDNSGSMDGLVSGKSQMTRSDAACALAVLLREICPKVVVIGFSDTAALIPARRGFALVDAIKKGPTGNTDIQVAVDLADKEGYDRIIVVTDEQSSAVTEAPKGVGYCINVGNYKNGIGYGKWTHIDGWSDAILSYIQAAEQE